MVVDTRCCCLGAFGTMPAAEIRAKCGKSMIDFGSMSLNEGDEKVRILSGLLEAAGYTGAGLTNNAFARHNRFLREFAPKLSEAVDLSSRHVIEIGCGVGSVTHSFAQIFRHVDAYEINENSVELVRRRAVLFGLENLRVHLAPAKTLVERALRHLEQDSFIILYAVLEHMTETERLDALSLIWSQLGPNNYVYVGNTPNRLAWNDLHTHERSFLLSLPDYTLRKYFEFHSDVRFAKQLLKVHQENGSVAFSEYRARRGLGVSFHDFEIGCNSADLNECVVVGDIGSPGQLHDTLLHTYFLDKPIDVPLCFALRDMNFLYKKPTEFERPRNRAHNLHVRSQRAKIVSQALQHLSNRILSVD